MGLVVAGRGWLSELMERAEMLYFAYGSNLLRRRIEERLGPCRLHGIGWLSGYQLRFHKVSADGSGKCNVYRTDKMTDRVHGALFDLSSTQKAKLDEFEGPGYDSVPITVHSDFGAHESETYIAKPASIDPTLIPFDWYKAFVVEGGEEAGLPAKYMSTVRSTRAVRDPDTARGQKNWCLMGGMQG